MTRKPGPAAPPDASPPAANPAASEPEAEGDADIGAELVLSYGCLACHSTDGAPLVGPTWQGLYGTEESLEGGGSALVNAQYITESIKDPNAKITQGFTAGLMPATLGVKDEEIPHIIAYIRSLK